MKKPWNVVGILAVLTAATALMAACGGGTSNETTTSSDPRTPQKPLHFEGNGSQNIGTVTVTDDALLEWHRPKRDGSSFFIMDADSDLYVSNTGDKSSGSTVLAPGTYRNVKSTRTATGNHGQGPLTAR